jgi:hypothetical protein
MSSYVDREWFYYLRGRELLLYKMLGGSSNERISQSGVLRTRGRELMYPNEDIANGLRVEYTALNEPFIAEAFEASTGYASGTGMSFDPGPAATISDTNDGFADTGKAFAQGDKIRVQGSSSNDGDYTLSSSGTVDEDTLTITGTFTTEAAGERITITQIPLEDSSPDSTSHINLNRMLSLAVVDYLKAMTFESAGEIDKKEYYMKEFFGKLGDNESNKRNISVSFPSGPFAVR